MPLAVGSVAGSGILVLPSAVYAESGGNSLLVWLVATVLCLPMLVMFQDIVREHPGGNAIESCIAAGLGHTLGRCVPVMFICIVSVGLPAGALVAGEYLARATGTGGTARVLTAAAVLGAALVANLVGVKANTRTQHAGVAALVVMALVLVASAIPAFDTASVMAPDPGQLDTVLPGVVLAFWAFAGFENLTFLSGQLRSPRRDFLPITTIALSIYGALTAALTMAIALRIPRGAVNDVAGLLQLAEYLAPSGLAVTAVTVIAVGAMVLNAVSWVWGVSHLVADAFRSGTLPGALADSARHVVPRRSLAFLAVLFGLVGGGLTLLPGLLVDALAVASSTFIVLYLLCIAAYTRIRGLTWRSVTNIAVLAVLVATLVDSGWRSLYGLAALAVALVVIGIMGIRGRPRVPASRRA